MPRGISSNPAANKRLRANRNGHAAADAPTFNLPASDLDAALESLHRGDENPHPRESVRVEGQPWTRVAEVSLEDIPSRTCAPGKFEDLWREVELRLEATSALRAISYYFPDHVVGKTARESVSRYAQRTRQARVDDPRKFRGMDDFEE